MNIQKTIPAHVSFSRATALSPFTKTLLKAKIIALARGIMINDDLISEIDSFVERNNLAPTEGFLHTSCPNCLKAHAIRKANELGMDKESISFLSAILEGDVGHQGYYLNGEDLIKIT